MCKLMCVSKLQDTINFLNNSFIKSRVKVNVLIFQFTGLTKQRISCENNIVFSSVAQVITKS